MHIDIIRAYSYRYTIKKYTYKRTPNIKHTVRKSITYIDIYICIIHTYYTRTHIRYKNRYDIIAFNIFLVFDFYIFLYF